MTTKEVGNEAVIGGDGSLVEAVINGDGNQVKAVTRTTKLVTVKHLRMVKLDKSNYQVRKAQFVDILRDNMLINYVEENKTEKYGGDASRSALIPY